MVLAWIYWKDLSWLQKGLLILGEIFLAPDLSNTKPIFLGRQKNDQQGRLG